MITGFRNKALRIFAESGDASKLPVSSVAVDRVERQLVTLDAASAAKQMDLPGWYFHQLKGRPVRYSVRVTANWRLTFGFADEDAKDVDLEDYH